MAADTLDNIQYTCFLSGKDCKHEANEECEMCEQWRTHNESARIKRNHYETDSVKKPE